MGSKGKRERKKGLQRSQEDGGKQLGRKPETAREIG